MTFDPAWPKAPFMYIGIPCANCGHGYGDHWLSGDGCNGEWVPKKNRVKCSCPGFVRDTKKEIEKYGQLCAPRGTHPNER